jgi:ribosomal-protein-alanine N-acetyltransferase
LQTARLTLRLLRETDRGEFVRVHRISREFYRPWMPISPADQTLDEFFEQSLERATRGWSEGKEFRTVAVMKDGRIAGFFNLNEIVRGSFFSCYAGWRANVEVARQGYATEALNGLLDLAFAPAPSGIGLHRVQANIIPSNEASLRLAARCGFRREGLAPRYLQINGRWQDHVMLAKLADEHELEYLKSPVTS